MSVKMRIVAGPSPTDHKTHKSLSPTFWDIMTLDEFFYQVFEYLPRQGPGCPGATRKVFSYLPPLPRNAAVLDVGCGSGTQTRDLARLTTGTIMAVDNHPPFLDTVSKKSKEDGTMARIKTIYASMDALPFDPGQFDLIWSEGAVFIMGFKEGLAAWKPLLKKGGFMVVSDAAWFEPNPPQELVQWWEKEGYIPKTEDQLREQIKNAGLNLIRTYRLPEAGWWDNYYVPMLARVADLRKTHGSDPACAAILDSLEYEAETYRKYKRYYGYMFFVMQNE
jgi:SAM-dependent methyltransferase